MKKLTLAMLAALAFVPTTVPPSDAGKPCARKVFKTELIRSACNKGGQAEAKRVMKKFLKEAKKKASFKIDCNTCHAELAPNYPTKDNALELFKKYGGR